MRLFRNLFQVRSVSPAGPNILRAVSIADEDDTVSVRGEMRLAVERRSRQNRFGFSTRDWNGVDVAEQFEDDRLAVRRDVERYPSAFVRVEGNRTGGMERKR